RQYLRLPGCYLRRNRRYCSIIFPASKACSGATTRYTSFMRVRRDVCCTDCAVRSATSVICSTVINADAAHRSGLGAQRQRLGQRILETQRIRSDGEALLEAKRETFADPFAEHDHLSRGPCSACGADAAASHADIVQAQSLRNFGRDRLAAAAGEEGRGRGRKRRVVAARSGAQRLSRD